MNKSERVTIAFTESN